MSDNSTANKNYYRRIAQELAEFDTPQARYQAVLDWHWESQREQDEPEDMYEVTASSSTIRGLLVFTKTGAIGIGASSD